LTFKNSRIENQHIGDDVYQVNAIYNIYGPLFKEGKNHSDIPEQTLEELNFLLARLKEVDSSSMPLSTDYYYTLGRDAFYRRDFKTAESYLIKAVEQDLNNIQARNLLLTVYATRSLYNLSERRYEEVVLDVKKAERYSRYEPIAESFANMGYVYKNLYLAKGKTSDLEKAKKKFEMAIALFDSDLDKDSSKKASALNGLGNYYLLKKDYDEAIKMFLEAIDKIPSYAAAHNDLAIAYEGKMGEGGSQRDYWRQKAIEEWKKAVLFGKRDITFSEAQLAGIEKRIQTLQQS
jgi:tetratricopeptide (TPR) repeat protein